MIEAMRACHQELEVTDMTGMKPSYGAFESYLSLEASAAPTSSTFGSSMKCESYAMAAPMSRGLGGPPMMKMKMSAMEACDSLEDEDRAFGRDMMMSLQSSKPRRDMASEAYVSSTVKGISN